MTYLRINGMDLYSEVRGEGPPVLLLHGGFCSLESLRAPSDALEADRTVYAVERPGPGRSSDVGGDDNRNSLSFSMVALVSVVTACVLLA